MDENTLIMRQPPVGRGGGPTLQHAMSQLGMGYRVVEAPHLPVGSVIVREDAGQIMVQDLGAFHYWLLIQLERDKAHRDVDALIDALHRRVWPGRPIRRTGGKVVPPGRRAL